MFYLTTHSTHFILLLKGVEHMLKDHSDSERGNPLPPHGLLFPINSKGSFTDRITHTTAFVTPVVEHWLEREIAQWVNSMNDRSDDPLHHERTLLPRSYILLRPTAILLEICSMVAVKNWKGGLFPNTHSTTRVDCDETNVALHLSTNESHYADSLSAPGCESSIYKS